MIPLEQQVVSLDLAKRLKELGMRQESLYNWRTFKDSTRAVIEDSKEQIYNTIRHDYEYYAAFTVAELSEILPTWWLVTKGTKRFRILWWKESPEEDYARTLQLRHSDYMVPDDRLVDAIA